jgi:hypothetical protein
MSSFQITITPSERAAGRFVSKVRRSIQKALAEEAHKRGLTQSDLARAIGVNRSVVCREIRGHKDLTLGRVGELAWALGRIPTFELFENPALANVPVTQAMMPPLKPMAASNLSGEDVAIPRIFAVAS